MSKLDPVKLFQTLCRDLPSDLHKDLLVTGSLAAAYAFKVQLSGHAVNTKDADLIVHPANNTKSAREMALRLLGIGWRRTEQCKPSPNSADPANLRAIRLLPPAPSNEYFIEFLNLPAEEQREFKLWVPVELNDGWYGLPSFKFMGLMAWERQTSEEGLQYAAPPMMTLSNLLSHPQLSDVQIESGEFAGLRRSAKDLGRVLALAYLSGNEATLDWPAAWQEAIAGAFPRTWRNHARACGNGLREMLGDDEAMEEARETTESGLLSGLGVGADALRALGARVIADAIEPLEAAARR